MDQKIRVDLLATTDRHSELVDGFSYYLTGKRIKGELDVWSDTVALSYQDDKLIDVNEMGKEDKKALVRLMGSLPYVEPDIMVFQKNDYLNNFRNTRKAGCPDLVIEVWSNQNDEAHRNRKWDLYSSSPTTEHWYIEQEEDIVQCYLGDRRLSDQHLLNILKTQNGLEFDMKYLATLDDASMEAFLESGYRAE